MTKSMAKALPSFKMEAHTLESLCGMSSMVKAPLNGRKVISILAASVMVKWMGKANLSIRTEQN